MSCRFNHRNVVPLFGLPVYRLSDFIDDTEVASVSTAAEGLAKDYPAEFLYFDIDLIPITNDSVTRYYYGAIPEGKSTNLQRVRKQHLVSAMISTVVASRIYKTWKPSGIVSNMQTYSAWAPYYEYFRMQGARYSSVNYSPWDYHSVRYNLMDHFFSNQRYLEFLKHRQYRMLDEAEKIELEAVLNTRFTGTLQVFQDGEWYMPDARISDFLKIDPTKRNIFLPSNVYWDKGLNEIKGLFEGVIDWVLTTIALIEDRSDVHLYIKPHPAEKYFGVASAKGVADFIYEHYPVLPENVTLILPEFKLSPYELLPLMDVGVLFSGTLGLEMMLRNMPVISTGQAPYRGLKFAAEPTTLDEYKNLLLGSAEIAKPFIVDVDLFAYFYFIKTLIPWHLTKQAFADRFDGFEFSSLDALLPGKDQHLDHLCNCILDRENTVPEAWPKLQDSH